MTDDRSHVYEARWVVEGLVEWCVFSKGWDAAFDLVFFAGAVGWVRRSLAACDCCYCG